MSRILLLVDGSALIHRAYHAMPTSMTNKSGQPTGAVYGFVKMLLRAVTDLQPTHIVIALDRPEPTFRKGLYIGYQANRPPADDELKTQFAMTRDLITAMDIPLVDKAGFEADDVIGTIASQVVQSSAEDQVLIITGDKDLMQLVNSQVNLVLPKKGMAEVEKVDIAGVQDKLHIRPDQVVDYKGLIGDSSDNYPGVHGIGPKTAEKLLEQFDSYPAIYQHLDDIDEKIRTKLINGRDGGDISYDLARIRTDVDVAFDWDHAKGIIRNPAKLAAVLNDYGFGSIVRQFDLEHATPDEQMSLF